MHARLPAASGPARWPTSYHSHSHSQSQSQPHPTHWPYLWQPTPTQPATIIHPALAAPPVMLAGEKRKLADPDSPRSSSSSHSPLDALRKRQRRFQSHSSFSDSDDPDDSPRTPANTIDDAMDWSTEPSTPPTGIVPIQSSGVPPWRTPSPSEAIHRLELLREAKQPLITTYASSFTTYPYSRGPPPSKAIPMSMQVKDDEYIFSVALPGYNIDNITVSCKRGNVVTVVADIWHLPRECCHQWDITFDSDVHTAHIRATMDKSSSLLTITARRYRRYVPIEYQVERRKKTSPGNASP